MNNQRVLIVAAVVIVLVVGAYLILAKKPASSLNASPSPSVMVSMSSAPAATDSAQPTAGVLSETPKPPVATSSVAIEGFAFIPQQITVKSGTKVTWTNQDSVGHNITETDGLPGPKSSTINQGQSYSFTFTTPGTYHYMCSIHPEMTGAVIVTQ